MSPTKTKSNAGVQVTPASASYLDTVEITVTGLERDKQVDVVIGDPQGHSQTLRRVNEQVDETGTYTYTYVVDSRGPHTIDVVPAPVPVASSTFRGV